MYDSPEAAQQVTVKAWKNSKGQYFFDEHMARYNGSSHATCACGGIYKTGWGKCDNCRHKDAVERYNKMPFKEWDETTPLVIFGKDIYFFDVDDIHDYCDEHECNSEDLMLVICAPNYMHEVETDIWADIMPENSDGYIPKVVQDKINELNTIIKVQKPLSWRQGSERTSYKIIPE